MITKKEYANIEAHKAKTELFGNYGATAAKTDAFVENLLFRKIERKPDTEMPEENTALSESLSFANLDKNRNLVFDD